MAETEYRKENQRKSDKKYPVKQQPFFSFETHIHIPFRACFYRCVPHCVQKTLPSIECAPHLLQQVGWSMELPQLLQNLALRALLLPQERHAEIFKGIGCDGFAILPCIISAIFRAGGVICCRVELAIDIAPIPIPKPIAELAIPPEPGFSANA